MLRAAGLLRSKEASKTNKGSGFRHPEAAHRQWHIDITYLKIKGVFYYLILVLDGYSRYLVGWALREQMMTEQDVQIALQKAHEAFPEARV
jgi:putative transposase